MKLLLVDGHYYVYRSFFAIRELRKPDGTPTNAIFGFAKTLRRMMKHLAPDLGAVVWDMGLPKRRTELQPEYKQQRSAMPDEMRPQIQYIRELVPKLGFASVGLPDTEADDLIASYVIAAQKRGDEVVLATNDKDLFALVNDTCRVYTTSKYDLAEPKDEFALLGVESVKKKWGVEPNQIPDVLALTGDTVDNIAGVSGIGPRTAKRLMQDNGSIDAMFANPLSIGNLKVREKFYAAKEQINQNREMVRLDLDLPLPVALDDLRIAPQYPELIESLEFCNFKGLTAEVRAEAEAKGGGASAPPPQVTQGELLL